MRLFVAVDVPVDVKNSLRPVYKHVSGNRVIPVPIENLHYTLQFLGEVGDSDAVRNALESVSFKPFEIVVKDIGFFPRDGRVRVLWIGADKAGGDSLASLAEKVSSALAPLGYSPDHEFTPHLTIARVKQQADTHSAITKFKNTEFAKFTINHFVLVKSMLGPEGAKHTVIGEYYASP
jgi:2'-5' RNA ligase